MEEHPTTKDLVKEGTARRVSRVRALKAVGGGLLADVRNGAGRLWRRVRRR